MLEKLIETVLQLLDEEENELLSLKIEAKLNEILFYLNRDELTEEILPSVSVVIADCIKNDYTGIVQSFKEGDMSITFAGNSPFFGKLDAFKIVRGAK